MATPSIRAVVAEADRAVRLMRAVVLTEYGGPEVLRVTDVADPVPGPDEILVDVEHTAVNRADVLAAPRALRRSRAGRRSRSPASSTPARSPRCGSRVTRVGASAMP